MAKPAFKLYVIQIGDNREVLYVNYSLSIESSFVRFKEKHPHLRHSILRPDLYQREREYRFGRQAQAAAKEFVRELESKGYEVIAGGPLITDQWQTYVIEIDGDPLHVYVGETNYPREKRFQQHIYHFNSARALMKSDFLELSQNLCDDNVYWNKAASKAAEKALADKLKSLGYRVEGGT